MNIDTISLSLKDLIIKKSGKLYAEGNWKWTSVEECEAESVLRETRDIMKRCLEAPGKLTRTQYSKLKADKLSIERVDLLNTATRVRRGRRAKLQRKYIHKSPVECGKAGLAASISSECNDFKGTSSADSSHNAVRDSMERSAQGSPDQEVPQETKRCSSPRQPLISDIENQQGCLESLHVPEVCHPS